MSVRSLYVLEVPKLPGRAENVPRGRSPSAQGSLVKQQPCIASGGLRGNEIIIVYKLIMNPSALIVES